jgi:hypothetical protein
MHAVAGSLERACTRAAFCRRDANAPTRLHGAWRNGKWHIANGKITEFTLFTFFILTEKSESRIQEPEGN